MDDALNALVLIGNYIVVPGLAYGSQLALGALGVTMIYAVLRFSNFGHGEIMSFGTMLVILTTFAMQDVGLSISPLPTALVALPVGIVGAIGLCLLLDRYVYKFHRQQRASPVIYLIVSIGTMFIIGGLIRFIIGPKDRNFADGERFIMKASAFKANTGLAEGLAIKTSQGVTVLTAFIVVGVVLVLKLYAHRQIDARVFR